MRVEELEAACHAASFESSLRRAMAQTSPACSVSASTDSNASSQSYIPAEHDNDNPSAATPTYHHHTFDRQFGQSADAQHHSYGRDYRDAGEAQDDESSEGAGEYIRREGSETESQASTSETEVSGLKQQRREWEAEREALLREMNNLRSLASRTTIAGFAYLPSLNAQSSASASARVLTVRLGHVQACKPFSMFWCKQQAILISNEIIECILLS